MPKICLVGAGSTVFDPHTAAELSLGEIEAVVDALIEAHGNLLPVFTQAAA